MRIVVISVGKIKERGLRAAVDDYVGRIQHFAHFEEIELKDGSDPEVASRFEKAIPGRSIVVALEVGGRSYSSEEFAGFLERTTEQGGGPIVFLIGGSHGLPAAVSKRAQYQLSLSTMTLPHRLARLFLLEQIYRGFTIWRSVPYAH